MKRLTFEVSEEREKRIQELMKQTGARTRAELLNYALSLYDWAVSEASRGKAVASFDKKEKQINELEMPPFSEARRAGQTQEIASEDTEQDE